MILGLLNQALYEAPGPALPQQLINNLPQYSSEETGFLLGGLWRAHLQFLEGELIQAIQPSYQILALLEHFLH
jgi:hypothetical protein